MKRATGRLWLAAMSTLLVAVAGTPMARTRAEKTIWDGVYTTEQADRGEVALKQRCASCGRILP